MLNERGGTAIQREEGSVIYCFLLRILCANRTTSFKKKNKGGKQ